MPLKLEYDAKTGIVQNKRRKKYKLQRSIEFISIFRFYSVGYFFVLLSRQVYTSGKVNISLDFLYIDITNTSLLSR